MRNSLRYLLACLGLLPLVRLGVRRFNAAWHEHQAQLSRAYSDFLGQHDASLFAIESNTTRGAALLVGYDNPKLVLLQVPVVLALRLAGFRVVVLAPYATGSTAQFYLKLGADEVIGIEDIERPVSRRTVGRLLNEVATQDQLVAITYQGVPCGKFIASTAMRRSRQGNIDPTNSKMAGLLREATEASVRAIDVARRIVGQTRPSLVFFYDRGYTPDGELFEVALANGAHAVTLNGAHRSGLIMCKRYGPDNRDRHFAAPSVAVWDRLCEMPWSETNWQTLRNEIEQSYRSGTWYDEVGTQFNKKISSREDTFTSLGLDPNKKVAVIFPHLFWDATFFWGEDLFADYKDWFCQAIKAAAANDRLNWIIKIHPAGLVKDARDGYRGESSELIAIRETLGILPAHIKLIPVDSPISTFSLFDVMDYCLTVRGTIGVEAAAFGAAVLTAGTGRYDGYGFTIDAGSREEYLAKLAKLEEVSRPAPKQIELARRYAYGLFLLRPLKLDSVKFHYRRDQSASLQIVLGLRGAQQLTSSPDLKALASWLAGSDEDLVGRTLSADERGSVATGFRAMRSGQASRVEQG